MKPTKLSLAVSLAVINARKKLGWSQTEAAKHLGTTRNGLSLIECAKRLPSFPVTVKLVKLLSIDITVFYDIAAEEDRRRKDAKGEADLVSLSSH